MLEVFDRSRQRITIAKNAHGVTENLKLNSINYLTFSLPFDDPKNAYCQPLHYVRWNGGELYRIMPRRVDIGDTGAAEYQCESVLATMIDRVLYGYHHVGGYGVTTADCIRYILGKQSDWVLAECDYSYQYEYGWEQESLLSALFSIATPMQGYRWITDTSVYPWRLSLKRLQNDAPLYVHGMISYAAETTPQQICTRIYPLGYGEGVNQLTIKEVNGGIPYLQSPDSIIAKYGIIEKIWTDRRYEDPASLKAAAQVLLNELQELRTTYEIDFLEPIEIGRRIKYGALDAYVTGVHLEYGDVTRQTITLCNYSTDIASRIADIADKLRTEQCYAQGATQIYGQALQANGSPDRPLKMDFIIPAEMRIVNAVYVKIRIEQFRAYSSSTSTNPQKTTTSSTKDSEVTTSEAAGYMARSSNVQENQIYLTSKETSITRTGIVDKTLSDYLSDPDLYHAHTLPERYRKHKHILYAKDLGHTHSGGDLQHAHGAKIPPHTHEVEIPAHNHNIVPGIYKFGNPSAFAVSVNGVQKQYCPGTDAELDLTAHLLGANGKIPRDTWISVEIAPNDLAYISIDLVFQGFVQSRGNATV